MKRKNKVARMGQGPSYKVDPHGTLDLTTKQLKQFECPEVIPGLQKLDLSNNELATLPETLALSSTITIVRLVRNKFSVIPKCLSQLLRLKSVDFSHNAFTELEPSSLVGFKNILLQEFLLANCSLGYLPPEISSLRYLKILELSGNQLKAIPQSIGALYSLNVLRLQHNQISELPSTIGGLVNLEILNLNNNQITDLPVAIGQLAQLRFFHIENNLLEDLPYELLNCTKLNNILLTANPLELTYKYEFVKQPVAEVIESLRKVLKEDQEADQFHDVKPNVISFSVKLRQSDKNYRLHLSKLCQDLEGLGQSQTQAESREEGTASFEITPQSIADVIRFLLVNRSWGVKIEIWANTEQGRLNYPLIFPDSLNFVGPVQGYGFPAQLPERRIRVFHFHCHFNPETETRALRTYNALIQYVLSKNPEEGIPHKRVWYERNGPHVKWSWEIHAIDPVAVVAAFSFLMANKPAEEYVSALFHVRTHDINEKNEYDDHAFRLAWIGNPDADFDINFFHHHDK